LSSKAFKNAGNIVYGWGALEHLKTVTCHKALVVTGKGAMEKLGVLARAVSYLQETGAEVETIRGVQPEPPIEDLEPYLEITAAFQPDLFVALGGGSVIDTTKALWAIYEYPDLDKQELLKPYVSRPYPLPRMGQNARLVAIPSTSGTGSETSTVAVLIEARSRVKRVLLSNEIMPTMAIIDPEIPSHMPAELTAHTGMDALTHALESVISPWSNDFSEPLAMKALSLIFQHLRAACRGQDPDAREKMHYASTLAGMAINNSITGLAHGMDKIGQQFDLPHGVTCGILLPYTIAFNAAEAGPHYARIGRSLGLEGRDEEELTFSLLRHLVKLAGDIGIPRDFQEAGIEEGPFCEKIELVSEYALKAGPTVFSPKVPSRGELRQIYLDAFHGRLPV
jgi:alcohol dehydrogenase class IV